jgi:hypothetical protein
MANFAKIGLDSRIYGVVHVRNEDILLDGYENEVKGISLLTNITGWPLWKQTSVNTKFNKYYNQDLTLGDQSKAFRGNFAKVGGHWDEYNQIFLDVKPYPSWILDLANAKWKAPVEYPTIEKYGENINQFYIINWNESLGRWEAKDYNYENNFVWNTSNLSWDSIS